MSDTVIEAKPANPRADEWAERIAAQRRSGMSVKQFCKEQGLTEYSFCASRKRLQQNGPVLASGERLRIGPEPTRDLNRSTPPVHRDKPRWKSNCSARER
jgi:hypothetical protein